MAQEVGKRLAEREVLLREMPQILKQRIIYVAHDHLNRERGALKSANPDTDVIVMVESQRMLTGRPWNLERLFFILSSARHFANDLIGAGFTVRYIQAPTTIEGLEKARGEFGDLPIVAAQASSHRQLEQLTSFGVEWVTNDFFLTSREQFETWAGAQRTYLMENFYRQQRLRLNILVENGKPVGDRWNFDEDNRLPPPKNYEWQSGLEHSRDEIDVDVSRQLAHQPTSTWATTRSGALAQLEHFVTNHLDGFGPYEDAVSKSSWSMHHSLLSPYLNLGMLTPHEVLTRVLQTYRAGRAQLQSVEAFVRQVIGWREYINGMYWHLGEGYAQLNRLNATRPLPPLFADSSKTQMACVSSTVAQVEARAWTHHIPRLMILSNLALSTGTNPQRFLDWMREQFVDASDWVMVPNIIGMATHADGGLLMSKPYAAGGAYLNRMTEHCKGCPFDPKKRVGEDACPFTTLYWDFLDRNRDAFARNHRMSQALGGLDRLNDLDQVRQRAQEVLARLDNGNL